MLNPYFKGAQNIKQQKNRESARNSRIRKKIYLELLEQKTKNLEAKVKQLESEKAERNEKKKLEKLDVYTQKNIQ